MPAIDAYVKLLLHCNGTNGSTVFPDSSSSMHSIVAYNGAAVSTAQNKFGGASAYFDGSEDFLDTAASGDFDFGTSAFTIDMWVYALGERSEAGGLISTFDGSGYGGWALWVGADQRLIFRKTLGVTVVASSIDFPIDQWVHVAVVRNGDNVYLFQNGFVVGTTNGNASTDFTSMSHPIVIGKAFYDVADYYHYGYIDELRVSNGIARWNVDFTPPDDEYYTSYPRYFSASRAYEIRASRQHAHSADYRLHGTILRAASLSTSFSSRAFRAASLSASCKIGTFFPRLLAKTSEYSERSPRRAALTSQASFRAGRSISSTANYVLTAGRLASIVSGFGVRVARMAKLSSSIDFRAGRLMESTAQHDQFCRYGYNVYIDGTLAGFVDYENGARTLPGVALADGEHVVRIEPSRWLWQDAAYSEEITFTISGGELASKSLPVVLGLAATALIRGKRWISWTWADSFLTTPPETFGLWFSATSPVDVSGAPNKTITAMMATETHAYRYAQSAAKYVAVAAIAGTNKGTASELLLAYPTDTITSPDNQYITGAQI